jgi:hypothetical protein
MKNVLSTALILFLFFGAFAQDKSKFQNAMAGTLKKMEQAKSADAYAAAANQFTRIAANEKNEWTPHYYATFIKTFRAFEAKDKAAAAGELAELTPSVEGLLEMESVIKDPAAQSEVHTLLAMMYSARMMENPMALGAKFSPLNAQHLEKAMTLNQNNPRPYILKAQTLFYTPEAFGGDKVKAKELSEKALALFAQEARAENNNFMPRWGKDQAENLSKQIK